MYTQASIDNVRQADIVSVIQHYCPDLKKKGASYFCKSPFKDEKTASFNVNNVKNNWVDYATGQHGDGIKFVKLFEQVEFPEAVKIIADICNITLQEEAVPEEVKLKQNHTRNLLKLADNVAYKYVKNFKALPANHWAKAHVLGLGYTEETLLKFQIGFATNTNEITKGCIEKAILQHAIAIGVSRTKTNNSYDFFQNRWMVPVTNVNGETIGFGGRRENGEQFEKWPKWINGAETEIYNKTKTLFGLYQAKQAIRKSGYAILTEGYTDVITMHQKDCEETVATCGTALTVEHTQLLKRLCEHVVLFRDGDNAGVNASIRDLDILLKESFRVSIIPLPSKEDPDSWARGQLDMKLCIKENIQDAIDWRLNILAKEGEADSYAKSKAINQAAELLLKIKNEIIQAEKLKVAASIFSEKQATFKNILLSLKKEAQIEREAKEKKAKSSSQVQLDNGLPKGANQQQYLKDRFCIVGNACHFTKGDGFFPGTNFLPQALFHIKGKKENKRLVEITTTTNQKYLIDFDSESFVSFSDFKKQLILAGPIRFLSGTTTLHFDLLAGKLLDEFNTALELQTMGWNTNGFWAFSNAVSWNNKIQEVNKYGIIHLEGVDTFEEDDYNKKVEYYYSPAYSVMHKKNQDGDDPYENDRKFVYKKSKITLHQWMEQMITVFEEKGRIGMLFNFATLFRDLFLKNYAFFPLLGGFGEKQSGKSALGKILQNFFFYELDALELNQATLVGFNRRLSRTTNTTVFLDEYHDKIDDKMFQALKGAWNGLGREKGMATNDKRTIYDKVNSAIYYAGQYLPTRDDNSLGSRTISMQFPLKNYTPQQKEAYNKLLANTTEGISSLVFDILEHREYFAAQLPRIYNEVTRSVLDALKDQDYEERIASNYSVLLITHKILEDKIDLPFSYAEFFTQCIDGIIENSEAVQDSNGLTGFWNVLQWLFERTIIKEGIQFKIEKSRTVKYIGAKKEAKELDNGAGDQILYLRLNSVHQDYVKEITKREGEEVIGETTLRNYFKSRGYFIGLVKGKRFQNGVSSCYAFNYTKMMKQNIVSLEIPPVQQPIPGMQPDPKNNLPTDDGDDNDVPF